MKEAAKHSAFPTKIYYLSGIHKIEDSIKDYIDDYEVVKYDLKDI